MPAISCLLFAVHCLLPAQAHAQSITIPPVTIGVGEPGKPGQVSTTIQILLLLTILTLAPAILIMLTSFTRIIVVLSFLRQALGTQQMPPNQILIGLALFLTFFIMSPVWDKINSKALQPYLREEVTQDAALKSAVEPLREFMLRQTREKDLAIFVDIAKIEQPESPADIPLYVIIPAFIISELRIAFQIGFMIYIPFLVLDMVVASVLMSMGMLMLPPIMISLPFKLMLFVLVDGWYLIVGSLVRSFA
ncbi:MAG: flagellar type III secretion system pore protein FliP [Nitrospinota bacterium]